MEEDKIKDLFSDYRPDIKPDYVFMASLRRNLAMAEMVRKEHCSFRRRNRIAFCIAAAAGFVTGVLFMLILPYFTTYFTDVNFHGVSLDLYFLVWCLAGTVSAVISLNVYEVAIAGMKRT